jgi:serine/threonine-protein kinase
MGPQQIIAHYRVIAKLGEGGMGEVWRAVDTKLGREVAIKILPDSFAQDPDRLARFTREAQVLASLNHPNIAAIYGVEERALVMELVEGPTLDEGIAQGPMSVEDVLPILHQMVDALEYAHEKGVVHRDLKPANIKITPEGKVKVLDFGLAKALTPGMVAADPVSSPTLTMRATMAGTIIGTAAYMAPEQARGHNVDKRADIWAFGVVVYEMVTGRRPFDGETISDTLAAVLTREPEWERAPVRLRRLLRLCLAKNPHHRLRDIGDARALAEEAADPDSVPAGSTVRRGLLAWSVAGMFAAISLVAAGGWWHVARAVPHPLTRLSVDLGPEALTGANVTAAISPDGRRLVFAARGADGQPRLATRLLDQEQAILLPGTENGSDPFFSPDGQWVGFFADGKLKKISVEGGASMALCDVGNSRGASWGDDGNIILNVNQLGALFRVSAAGGAPQPLTRLRSGEVSHRWPQVLPGGETVLFTASPSRLAQEAASIEVLSLKTGQVKALERGGYYGRYLPSGHLVYVHQGVLFGVRFDAARLEVRGTPTPLLQDVAANGTGGGQFDFTAAPFGSGTLLYLAGKGTTQNWQLAWLDSSGKQQPLVAAPGLYGFPRFSPDGRKLAFTVAGTGISVYELGRDATTRLTANSTSPVWTPDGKHIVFGSLSGSFGLSWVRSDGSGEPWRLLEGQTYMEPWSLSPDGRFLAYHEYNSDTSGDLWILPLDATDPDHPKPGTPRPFLRTPADERYPRFSPDGHWMAYRSNESGTHEIYVQPFPGGAGGKWQISAGGGRFAVWSNHGRELFYGTADNRIMVVDYIVNGDSFIPGKPRLWSDRRISTAAILNLDLAPTGKGFAVLTQAETAGGEKGSVHVTMLLNYFDELRRKLP